VHSRRKETESSKSFLELKGAVDDKEALLPQQLEISYSMPEIQNVLRLLLYFMGCDIELKYAKDVYKLFRQQKDFRDEKLRIA